MYGLRSSPSAWQNHLAQIPQDLNKIPNVYKTNHGRVTAYILVYVDDLLFIGQGYIVNELFSAIQKQLMLNLQVSYQWSKQFLSSGETSQT